MTAEEMIMKVRGIVNEMGESGEHPGAICGALICEVANIAIQMGESEEVFLKLCRAAFARVAHVWEESNEHLS